MIYPLTYTYSRFYRPQRHLHKYFYNRYVNPFISFVGLHCKVHNHLDSKYLPSISWLQEQEKDMLCLLETWVQINSGSYHLEGLSTMAKALHSAFSPLQGEVSFLPLASHTTLDDTGKVQPIPLGCALHITKKRAGKPIVFFGGHMDTVYGQNHPFQKLQKISKTKWIGPGTADMKGGLVVLLKALTAFEKSPFAKELGWEVLITPDEEIGSPGSLPLLQGCAARAAIGLVFEPTFPDGALVSERKGSCKVVATAQGKAAHVGRNMLEGKNAIVALARFVEKASRLTDPKTGVFLNVGQFRGGQATNVVPDFALARLDIRAENQETMNNTLQQLERLAKESSPTQDDVPIALHDGVKSPPKPFDLSTQHLFAAFQDCGHALGHPLSWRATGGVCDGNKLAAAGLPTIDTLGVQGGALHSEDEYIDLPSLVEKSKLTALFLMRLASHELTLPPKIPAHHKEAL